MLSLLLPVLWSLPAGADEYVWIEGEDADSTDFNNHSWYCCSDIRGELLSPGSPDEPDSPGAWLAHYDNDGSEGNAQAFYSFEVSEGGSYDIWVRAGCYRVGLAVAVDGGDSEQFDTDHSCRESFNMNWPGLDHRFMGWMHGPRVELEAGSHTLEFEMSTHDDWSGSYPGMVQGGIDVIGLVNFDWTPAGAMPPDPNPGEAAGDEWFVFAPGDPPELGESVFELADHVAAPAGEHGALGRDGADFVFADETPAKFWGVGSEYPGSDDLAEQQARLYRIFGVNMVRLHPVENHLGVLQRNEVDARVLDPEALDELDRWFAILKENGIYFTFSSFFPHVVTEDDGIPEDVWEELSASGEGRSSYGFVTMVPELQDAEWAWMQTLLEHENPYTGMRYVDDPALAIVEVHNEDSIFWHSPLNTLSNGDAPNLLARLQQLWMEWLGERYASDAELAAAWGDGILSGDSLSNPTMTLYGAWEMGAEGPYWGEDQSARMGDFIRFLAELQRDFYEARYQQIRDLGFQGVIVSTAWRAGGEAADAANLWTDDVMDAIDRHAYGGGGDGNHAIVEGGVSNSSHLESPMTGVLAEARQQVEDKPFLTTEWTSQPPNQWKAEAAPLFAFYGMGLQGWDASYHFSASTAWLRGGWPSLGSYVSETPHYMGQFPALARAVYEGHVRESVPVAARRLSVDQVFQGFDALTQPLAEGGWDPEAGEDTLEIPAEVFAIGRVSTQIADGLDPSERVDWDLYWNTETGVITSETGDLTWDTVARVVTIDTPSTQGVLGWAGGSTWEFGDVTASVTTEFVSLLFTALDGEPLASSARVLVTAMAQDRQLGSEYNEDGSELIEVGGPPLLLEPVQATIAFAGGEVAAVTPLDPYGVPRDEAVAMSEDGSFRIDGRYRTTHYLVELGVGDGGSDSGPEDTGEESDSKGCGCAAASGSNPGGPWSLFGGLVLLGMVGWRRSYSASVFAIAGLLTLTGCPEDTDEADCECPQGPQGEAGEAGDDGIAGIDGLDGQDGLHCWDLDEDGECSVSDEDVDGDGACTTADCRSTEPAEGASSVQIVEVLVFEGTSPTEWTDLDLSDVVGDRAAFVSIRVTNDGDWSNLNVAAFRANEDTASYSTNETPLGSNKVNLGGNGSSGMVVTYTDDHGVVEWKTSDAREDMLVEVAMYF